MKVLLFESISYRSFHLLALLIIFTKDLSWRTQELSTNFIMMGICIMRELNEIKLKWKDGINNTSWKIRLSFTCTVQMFVWFGKETVALGVDLSEVKYSLE